MRRAKYSSLSSHRFFVSSICSLKPPIHPQKMCLHEQFLKIVLEINLNYTANRGKGRRKLIWPTEIRKAAVTAADAAEFFKKKCCKLTQGCGVAGFPLFDWDLLDAQRCE